MYWTFQRRDETCAHRDTVSTQRHGRRHTATIGDTTGSDDRQVNTLAHGLQQNERVDLFDVAHAGTFRTFNYQPVNAAVLCLEGRVKGRYRVIDHDPGFMQLVDVTPGVTSRRRHKAAAIVDQPADDLLFHLLFLSQEQNGEINAEGRIRVRLDRFVLTPRYINVDA